jgi:hypothetical protein
MLQRNMHTPCRRLDLGQYPNVGHPRGWRAIAARIPLRLVFCDRPWSLPRLLHAPAERLHRHPNGRPSAIPGKAFRGLTVNTNCFAQPQHKGQPP